MAGNFHRREAISTLVKQEYWKPPGVVGDLRGHGHDITDVTCAVGSCLYGTCSSGRGTTFTVMSLPRDAGEDELWSYSGGASAGAMI